MKYAFIAVALSTILAACGHGHDDHTPQEPFKVEEQSPYHSPMNERTGVPFAVPFAYEAPIDSVQMKYLNVGVARAIAEYKMVGEILKTDWPQKWAKVWTLGSRKTRRAASHPPPKRS